MTHPRSQALVKELVGKHLKEASKAESQRKDQISHFVLRLAYCRSEELRRWFLAQCALLGDMLAYHECGGFKQRTGDVLAVPAIVTFLQGSEDADNAKHATRNIDHRAAGAHGLLR